MARTAGTRWLPPLGLFLAGCALVPRSDLEESRRRERALRSEVAQLRSEALALRATEQNLTRRAVDDDRRVRELEEINARLERSVAGYQAERDRLVRDFDRLERLVRGGTDATSAATEPDRIKEFISTHAGCELLADGRSVSIPVALLFNKGSAELTPAGEALLGDLARVVADPKAGKSGLLVVGRVAGSDERRARVGPGEEGRLGLSRAERTRNALAEAAGLDPSRIAAAGFAPPTSASASGGSRIEVHRRRIDTGP
ncbi:MAG TPA: OmpA family protein [Isosphaeraceae bacterium]|jgi:flagellar motor protein MotB|nr:OmpA family protein [Isosphaeraceae bacterium]